jgi:predicted MPP superfamily phosphohydrolase
MRRRAFLLALTGGATGGYSKWIEPEWLEVSRVDCKLPGFTPSKPIRIVQLSDLHSSPDVPHELIEESVELAIREKPDFICVTGDFVTARQGYDKPWFVRVLSRLPAAAPTFGTLGNHDGGWWSHREEDGHPSPRPIADLIQEAGLEFLNNRGVDIETPGGDLTLVGLADFWSGEFEPEVAFECTTKNPVIVLSHNPDTKDEMTDFDWSLMLSGHTHGGQIVIPGIGSPWTPVRDKRYLSGLKEWEGRLIHVSRGVGNAKGIRFNCRPEINVLTIS